MYAAIESYCKTLTGEFLTISKERKEVLKKISEYVSKKHENNLPVNLIYICTHNSRRSHFGQIWAEVASKYFHLGKISTFSGGTEATAFNTHAINALKRVGFTVSVINRPENPVYLVVYDDQQKPVECFSKVYDDPVNPKKDFAAIMTCGEAEENCPFIPGVDLRIATTYEDPKVYDHTPQRDSIYDERCRQIALETLYVFSLIK